MGKAAKQASTNNEGPAWGWMRRKNGVQHCYVVTKSLPDGFNLVVSLCGLNQVEVAGPWQWQGWPSCHEDCDTCRRLFLAGKAGLRNRLESEESDDEPKPLPQEPRP